MDSTVNNLAVAISQSLGIELRQNISIGELKEKLANYIHHLINHDFNKLVSILYRIDVSEQKLKQLLEGNPSEDAGKIIATLIIERQLEKLKWRKQDRHNDNISEDDRW
jgi:hypothetical protein